MVRPWCCPEPRCVPLLGHQVGEAPTPGTSFICLGRMGRPVEFTYDGEPHRNDLNHCDYTPLKGLIRWQENKDDWRTIVKIFRRGLQKLEEARAVEEEIEGARP